MMRQEEISKWIKPIIKPACRQANGSNLRDNKKSLSLNDDRLSN